MVFFQEHPEMQPADISSFLQLQSTIHSVTKTFERDLYSLNTAVSDLTKLTNFLVETKLENISPWLAHKCISSLLQMLAPIAPAFAEQNWEDLQAALSRSPLHQTPSVFEQEWPRHEITPELSTRLDALTATATATCVVHINGKPRFSVDVPARALKEEKEAVEDLLVKAATATKEGEYWFTEKNQWAARKRIIVAKSGTTLNVVF
jgi:leucyl-tRNA synthetase